MPEDLIPKFLDALESVDPERAAIIRKADALQDSGDKLICRADIRDLDLYNLLNDYAPPYCYFGIADGDDADFGVWPDIDGLEMDSHGKDADVLRVAAGDDWPSNASDYEYVMEVNDHGNVTLFNAATRKEEWSIV